MKLSRCVSCLAALTILLAACSKEQRDQLAESVGNASDKVAAKAQEVTKQATESVQQAKEQVVADGEAKFKLDKEIAFGASFINLVTVKDRGSVLQLRSYSESGGESFPSYYFQANTPSGSINALSGQSISGTLFVKHDAKDTTWMSAAEQPVTLALESITDGKMKGRIASGQLASASGQSIPVTGTFEAMIEGGLE